MIANAQESLLLAAWTDKVIPPGFELGEDVFELQLGSGWLNTIYMQEFGNPEPFEIDIEESWGLYESGPWSIGSGAAIIVLNSENDPLAGTGQFRTAQEIRLSGTYKLNTACLQLKLAGANIWGSTSYGGTLFKLSISDQLIKSKDIVKGDFNYGWSVLLGHNHKYFLPEVAGISHAQAKVHVSYQATDKLSVNGHLGVQLALTSQLDNHDWLGISLSYNF